MIVLNVDVACARTNKIIQVITVHINHTIASRKSRNGGCGEGDHAFHRDHRSLLRQPEGESIRRPPVVEGDPIGHVRLHVKGGNGG